MKKFLSICLSVILVTLFLTPVSADDSRTKKTNSEKTSQPDAASRESSGGPRVLEVGGKKLLTEVRTGSAVALRATQLRKKNKGFAKAYDALLKRGGKPIFEKAGASVLAVETSRSAMKKVAFNPTQDIVDGDYEMSFFPVNNDSGTWEGLIYVKSPSGDATYAVAHDTTQEDFSATEIYYEEYYPGEGGGGPDNQGDPAASGGFLGRLRLLGRAGVTGLAFDASASEAGSIVNVFPRLQDFFTCLGIGIGEAVNVCRWVRAIFWQCMALQATAVILACLIITW